MVKLRLMAMMFLEFFVWGAWYTTIGVYMSEQGMGDLSYMPYIMNAVAAIIAPFFLGLIADRFFSTEKVLAFLHLCGGIIIMIAPQATASPEVFISLLLLYNLCYMPTIGLSNSMAFHNIENQEKDFPMIRVFGTIGWIVAGLMISFILVRFTDIVPEKTAMPLYLTGISSILLSLFSLTLPHTPPPAAGKKVSARSIVGIDAFKQLGSASFYVFLLGSFLICIPLAAYYSYTQRFLSDSGFAMIAATQTLGQMSEVVFMLLMPLAFARLGVKWMLLTGMLAWVLRYGFFALAAPDSIFWMIITGIVLHGICYDFFFVTGQIYVDKKARPEIRAQAQGLIVLVTYGLGLGLGAQIVGWLFNSIVISGSADILSQYQHFWIIPAAFAAVVMVLFALLFNDKVNTGTDPGIMTEQKLIEGETE
jgi:nucleoside transporter